MYNPKFWLTSYKAVQSNSPPGHEPTLIVLFLHELLNLVYADNALQQLFRAYDLQEHFDLLYASSKCDSEVELLTLCFAQSSTFSMEMSEKLQ